MEVTITHKKGLKGEITVPGDKSITHRAFMFALIARGDTIVKNYSSAHDCASTLNIVRQCGAEALPAKNSGMHAVRLRSKGIFEIKEPDNILNAENSGTTMRLLSGLFSGIKGKLFILSGDASLRKRPMKRIVEPLHSMGATIFARENGNLAPIAIFGNALHGIRFKMNVASAQVKSAVILATLSANGKSVILEKGKTRDHTEIMLKEFGGTVEKDGRTITVYPLSQAPSGREIFVPNDFSSAAYFIAAALITSKSEVLIKDVGVNKTRAYFAEKLKKCGADITLLNEHLENGEPVADILVKSSDISHIEVSSEEVPLLIDELPLIAVLSAAKNGAKVEGAKELRFKETDRIKAVCENMKLLKVPCTEFDDGFEVSPAQGLNGGVVQSFSDHRIAMSFALLGLISKKGITIEGAECVGISFPEFFSILEESTYE
jgi:3-phosphoshikimate 1-carboxyvinyltransferase